MVAGRSQAGEVSPLSSIRPIAITSGRRGDVLVVTIAGPLTAAGGDMKLRAAVAEALDTGERRIVIDFERLSTLDSSGLGELMRASTAVRNAGGRMAWAACPPTLLDILEITRVELKDVAFADSLDEAIRELG